MTFDTHCNNGWKISYVKKPIGKQWVDTYTKDDIEDNLQSSGDMNQYITSFDYEEVSCDIPNKGKGKK